MTALVIFLLVSLPIFAATRNRRSRPQPHAAAPLVDRVAFLERRVAELQTTLDQLRGAAPKPAPAPEPARAPTPPAPPPTPAPTAPPRVVPAAPTREPRFDWG